MKKILVLVCLFMPMFSNAICLGIFEDKDECKTRELLEELRKEEIKIIKQRKANEKIILQRCYDHLNRGAVDALNGYQKRAIIGSCMQQNGYGRKYF